MTWHMHQDQSGENTPPHPHMHNRVLTSLLFFANSYLCWVGLSKGHHYQAMESISSVSSSDDRLHHSTSTQCWHIEIYNIAHLFKIQASLDLCLYLWSWNAGQILYNNCYDLVCLTAFTLPFMLVHKSGNWEDEWWLYTCWEDIPKQLGVPCLGNSKHVKPTYNTSLVRHGNMQRTHTHNLLRWFLWLEQTFVFVNFLQFFFCMH